MKSKKLPWKITALHDNLTTITATAPENEMETKTVVKREI